MVWCRCWERKSERFLKRKKKEEEKEKGDLKKRHYRRSTKKNVGEKFLRVSEGLGNLEEKRKKEKREVWGKNWGRFLKKNRDSEKWKKKKILRKKKKRNFCLLWKGGKEIVITSLERILQKKNQSHLKLRSTSQRLVLQVSFWLLTEFLLALGSSFWLFQNAWCFFDWCGRKGPQIVMLKLFLCVFAMIFIQLMSLIPFDFVHVKNLFWIIQPCFINALPCFDRFSLIQARNRVPFLLLDSLFFQGICY